MNLLRDLLYLLIFWREHDELAFKFLLLWGNKWYFHFVTAIFLSYKCRSKVSHTIIGLGLKKVCASFQRG